MAAPDKEMEEALTEEICGAVVSPEVTVKGTGADTVRFPAASRAVAVSVCPPAGVEAVFQETE